MKNLAASREVSSLERKFIVLAVAIPNYNYFKIHTKGCNINRCKREPKVRQGMDPRLPITLFTHFPYYFVHSELSPTGAVVVYVPTPPERYLARKSPLNGLLVSKLTSAIVLWKVTPTRLVQLAHVLSL